MKMNDDDQAPNFSSFPNLNATCLMKVSAS